MHQILSTLSDYEKVLSSEPSLAEVIRLLEVQDLFDCPTGTEDTARFHSDLIDKILGFNIIRIEKELFSRALAINPKGNLKTWGHSLHEGNQTWIGLQPQTLLTPYSELKEMCELLNLKDEDHLIDLGAGYGRMGIVLSRLYPDVKFTGLEYVEERVKEGKRVLKLLNCNNASLEFADLSSEEFELPEANIYFLYDYGTIPHIRRTLKQIETLADFKKFKLVARGKGVRSLIQYEHPWLASVFSPLHKEEYSVYSTNS